MEARGMSSVLLSLLLLVLSPCLHCHGSSPVTTDDAKKLYIVYMGEKQHEDPNLVTALHYDTLSSVLGSKHAAVESIVYSYKHGFSGFAATLTETQAKQVAGMPGVVRVKISRTLQLRTTRSWDFLGLSYKSPASKLLHEAELGDGIIIGIVDSGIWPESKSFDDRGYGPVPARWKGTCQTGQSFNTSHCNRKVIGARWYSAGVPEEALKGEYLSARDLSGHGTHTASTAAGSYVRLAAAAWARGGAPRARLAMYKVAWGKGGGSGNDASVLAAIDDAIHDGVDVLSLSLGLTEGSWGSLQAVLNGITVVYAAGNDGPAPQTIENSSPWVITVAASTIDRSFPATITLGNNITLVGQALYSGNSSIDGKLIDILPGSSCDEGTLNATIYGGKVILCNTGENLPAKQVGVALNSVLKAGGVGLIFAQYTTNILPACFTFPCIVVDLEVHQQISEYGASSSTPRVKLSPTRTVIGKEVLAPRVAAFSSRGPSPVFPGILKPDVAAPGVSILAAVKNSYNFMDGTSMATPHVSGIVALLKSLHPAWSPAAIKSAIVTTASVVDGYGVPIVAEGAPRKLADPFDYGGGHINPNKAADPGLIYDIDPKDYKEFHCSWDDFLACETPQRPVYHLNLPSVSIPDLKTTVTVSRTVTNVGAVHSTYKAISKTPPGMEMDVQPTTLVFDASTRMQTFNITFSSARKVQGVYTFGSLTWKDGRHRVRIPIAVRTVVQDFYADAA